MAVKTNINQLVNSFENEAATHSGISERVGVVARGMIMEKLTNTLGEAKAKHFSVGIRPYPDGMTINITGNDEVATYIFHGASPHNIEVVNAQAMPLGNGLFASTVHHPGFDGADKEIKAAVHNAAWQAWKVVLNYG